MELNQCVLHFWSKCGDSSLTGWQVIVRTSWGLMHGHTDRQTYATTISNASGKNHPQKAAILISSPFYKHDLTLIPACISNHTPSKVWDRITYPFLNFNGCTVEVYEWISNFIPHFGCNYLSMLGLKLIHVSKRGPRSQCTLQQPYHHFSRFNLDGRQSRVTCDLHAILRLLFDLDPVASRNLLLTFTLLLKLHLKIRTEND